MNYTPTSFIIAFFLTNAVEFLPLHFFIKRPINLKLRALLITNSITLPIVWLIMPLFFDIYITSFFLIEFGIIVAETYLLKIFLKANLKTAFLVSFAMNVLSGAIGLFI